jgi:hypothetical protein
MTRGRWILWLAVAIVSVAVPMRAGAADLLYSCNGGAALDEISRGFYIENYSGLALNTVAIRYETNGQAGTYTVRLTAHQGTYDGPVIRSSTGSFSETGTYVYHDFQFSPISSNMTIAFVQELVSAPPDGALSFHVGECATGDADCASCPSIYETEDTTPPLSTFRRRSVGVWVWGTAYTPIDQSTWGALKSLFQ